MSQFKQTLNHEVRLLAAAAIVASLPLLAAAASAQSNASVPYTDPAEIDRAVATFTGVAIGEVGGARVPADPRLRLARCAAPLDVSWYGRNGSTLQVSCAGPETWRIFVATNPAPQTPEAVPVVSRGDPITVQVRGQGFSVQQTGEALENGAVGDWIGIRTARDTTPIRARIERPGFAIISVE